MVLAGLLAACHKAPPPAPLVEVEPTAGSGISAIRLSTLNDANLLSDDQLAFLDALQPLVLRENFRIEASRRRLKQIAAHYLSHADIGEEDFNWVKDMADQYELEPKSRSDHHFFDELLARMDVVPPSLVLAHVALAAGWPGPGGTVDTVSFRQHVCHQQFCINRGPFNGSNDPSVLGTELAIGDYMHSLNTDSAYATFRRQRAELRAQGVEPGGLALAPALKGHASVGELQVEDPQLMISANHLDDKD